MKHTVHYYLIQLLMLAMIFSFILGVGAAESSMWGWAIVLMFGPFAFGKLINFGKQIDFCEAYDRAFRVKTLKLKQN